MVWSDIREGAEVPKVTIYRAAKALMEKLGDTPAICFTTPASASFLERLGWVYDRTEDEGEVYLWR